MFDVVDQLEIGEKYYDYALPYEKIKTARYKKFNQVAAHLPELKKRSVKRVKGHKKFKEVFEEIEKHLNIKGEN